MGPISRALLADPATASRIGDETLARELVRETKEIEDAHKRRLERAERIAGLRGDDPDAPPASRRVDPARDPAGLSCAELYLFLRDQLERRAGEARADASKRPEARESPMRTRASLAASMTDAEVGRRLRAARGVAARRAALGVSSPEGPLDCMRFA